MWWKWFPWKFILKYVAQTQGFLDPILLLSRFNQFAQPSEVWAPVELMRAGAVFHARGLINSQVIQHNLDWVWPYWAERQFDPADRSFVPRAFSLTHINLTHRNWTAVGIPGLTATPLVDSRGLLMPFFDSWSIDAWVVLHNHTSLIPSRSLKAMQSLEFDENLQVLTECTDNDISLKTITQVLVHNGLPYCQYEVSCRIPSNGYLVVALRPYNPEGISFVHQIALLHSQMGWRTDKNRFIFFDKKPDYYRFSDYKHGDVFHWIHSATPAHNKQVTCNVGMATAMVAFECTPQTPGEVRIKIPLECENKKCTVNFPDFVSKIWVDNLSGSTQCILPYKQFDNLYNIALRTLIIHSPCESFAGPYTYKRFWFRDAAFIIKALLCAGLSSRAQSIISTFFSRQTADGYFLSQDGEWDSTGQALWAMNQFRKVSDLSYQKEWMDPIERASDWIIKKRRRKCGNPLVEGLFPPGFSAEHLGPNDYYYWDNFWGIAGLQAAIEINTKWGNIEKVKMLLAQIEDWLKSIDKSLQMAAGSMRRPIMPASPSRRPDSGSVGSLAAGYPLELWDATDERLMMTASYLYNNCCIDNAFYHNISHSGINPYLTLHIAEVFLRASDMRFVDLLEAIHKLASPTGQWPEAIHPQLRTGCMGDGQHVWAASEWIIMIRNCFVREEGKRLVLCQGIYDKLITSGEICSIGYTPTSFGPVKCSIQLRGEKVHIEWDGKWFDTIPETIIKIPGAEPFSPKKGQTQCDLFWPGKVP
jgi:hypothetical protein